jgi:uncharacterized protein YcbK (DUF882 family)
MIRRRREFLTGAGAVAGAAACWGLSAVLRAESSNAAARGEVLPRRIALENLHTNETLDVEYFRDGSYLPQALLAVEALLRDFRTGERHPIDPRLLDYLVQVAQSSRVDPAFSVISGYRSPATNTRLREQSAGVARRSLHLEGRAVDIRVLGVDCASLASRAEGLRRGGVGYYRASDFVHLDTGEFRTWKG